MMTNHVVADTRNLTGEKLGPDAANEMLDRLIEGAHFEIDHDRKRISTLLSPSSAGTWSSHSSIRLLQHIWNGKVSSTSTHSTMISTLSTASRGWTRRITHSTEVNRFGVTPEMFGLFRL